MEVDTITATPDKSAPPADWFCGSERAVLKHVLASNRLTCPADSALMLGLAANANHAKTALLD
jgi:hypothetical protein